VKAQESLLGGGDPAGDPDFDVGTISDLVLGDSVHLEDTALAGVRIRAGRVLEIGDGAVLVDCKLLAPEIRIGGDAALEDVLAFASRTLKVTGGTVKGGQFAALDTLSLDLPDPQEDWPVFYVQGRKVIAGPDTTYPGALLVGKASGEGIFLVSALGRAVYDQQIRFSLGPRASLGGLAELSRHRTRAAVAQALRINLRTLYDKLTRQGLRHRIE
jgi:hypothetical protein